MICIREANQITLRVLVSAPFPSLERHDLWPVGAFETIAAAIFPRRFAPPRAACVDTPSVKA